MLLIIINAPLSNYDFLFPTLYLINILRYICWVQMLFIYIAHSVY